jgi:hypothetical protein
MVREMFKICVMYLETDLFHRHSHQNTASLHVALVNTQHTYLFAGLGKISSMSVVFNLGYAYSWGYAKTS